ncbi:MAG: hypothetical protein V3R87_03630 [Dehalococcoidia bacterium]
MAMTFNFDIRPFGYQNDAITFGRMRIHSAGSHHEYAVDYKAKDGWRTIRGSVPRVKSGHRNFLHLLAAILDDIDLDALGENYVNVLAEVEEVCPAIRHRGVGDYPEGS